MARGCGGSTFRSWGCEVRITRVAPTRSTRVIRSLLTTCAAGLVCLSSLQAWAGAPTDQLKSSVDGVLRIVQDPQLKQESRAGERRAAIRREAEALFDFTETARRALGRHWVTLNDSQQREFVSLFTDLLERAYIVRIEQYSGERIVYAGDSTEGESATVKTKFVTKQGTEIPVDYRLLHRGDRWLVYDVSVEGVSLVANYRTQFDRIMRAGSYQELARKLRAHQSELSAPGAQQAATPRS
jgi:phospholipid transport system substrate-binding protein